MKKKKNYNKEKDINTKELRKMLARVLSIEPEPKRGVLKAIIFDGRQYSVRIPKKFADAIKLDPKKDEIKFYLEISPDRRKRPRLTAEVIKNE